MENPFSKFSSSYDYAIKNGIDPKKPETWDDNYKKRMLELSGIIPAIETEINEIKKVLKSKIKE